MERTSGVAVSRMLAGLQILVGYFSVAPRVPEPTATGPIVSVGWRGMPSRAPAPPATDIRFAVRPPNIRNELWLVFRGTRDRGTGCLVGEIVPDFQMRVLGLVPGAALAADEKTDRSSTSAWLGLLGLVLPIAIVMVFIVPFVQSRADRADWVRIDGVAGAEVDLDHRMVTYVLPEGTEKTSTVPAMRTVEEGDSVELYFPPGRPDLIEQDRSGFVLPYIVFGGFALLMTAFILGRFVIGLRRHP